METKYKIVNIDELRKNPWNPNEMTKTIQEHLSKEIKRVGFLQPILINNNGMIIDGEHRWLSAKAIGITEVPVIEIEVDDNQARILTMNMNQIKGENNPIKVAKLLEDLRAGFDVKELSDYLNMSLNEIQGYELLLNLPDSTDDLLPKQHTDKEVECPNCQFKFKVHKN